MFIQSQSPKYENRFLHWRHLSLGEAMKVLYIFTNI